MASCAVCGEQYQKFNSLQKWCSPSCGLELLKRKQAQKARRDHLSLKRKVRAEDRRYQLRKAQEAFNAYIRYRDKDKPCISCDRHHQGQYHAGHYRSVGAHPELRFNELGCHKQCAPCNNHKSGNIVEYRINLKERIGEDNLNWLEGPHEPQKWTLEEIREIRDYFKQKLKALQNQ